MNEPTEKVQPKHEVICPDSEFTITNPQKCKSRSKSPIHEPLPEPIIVCDEQPAAEEPVTEIKNKIVNLPSFEMITTLQAGTLDHSQ